MTPPLRFLIAVIGGWACARAAVLAPWPQDGEVPTIAAPPAERPAIQASRRPAPPRPQVMPTLALDRPASGTPTQARALPFFLAASARSFHTDRVTALRLPAPYLPKAALLPHPLHPIPQPKLSPHSAPRPFGAAPLEPVFTPRSASRWSFSAWALARPSGSAGLAGPGGSPPLASAGTLGASQAGARVGYRLFGPPTEPVTVFARLTSPARSLSGTEAAHGVEWQPSRRLPLRVAAERRQAVGSDGRSAFALLVHGGVSDLPVAAGFRLDAYGQAGAVGARSRDLFADGAARVTLPLDRKKRLAIGAGAWAAAQPGVSRIDIGPSATLRLPGATLSLDWRARVSGDARPASGPALTVSTGF